MFPLNLTGDFDFFILFISTQNKLSMNCFSKIWMIEIFAVVNYMVRKLSLWNNFYIDVSQTFTFNTVLSIWKQSLFNKTWSWSYNLLFR